MVHVGGQRGADVDGLRGRGIAPCTPPPRRGQLSYRMTESVVPVRETLVVRVLPLHDQAA